MQAAYGVQPGNHISVKSTSEALHLTLAYAAISSVVAAIQEWQDLRGAEVSLHDFRVAYFLCTCRHTTLDFGEVELLVATCTYDSHTNVFCIMSKALQHDCTVCRSSVQGWQAINVPADSVSCTKAAQPCR